MVRWKPDCRTVEYFWRTPFMAFVRMYISSMDSTHCFINETPCYALLLLQVASQLAGHVNDYILSGYTCHIIQYLYFYTSLKISKLCPDVKCLVDRFAMPSYRHQALIGQSIFGKQICGSAPFLCWQMPAVHRVGRVSSPFDGYRSRQISAVYTSP